MRVKLTNIIVGIYPQEVRRGRLGFKESLHLRFRLVSNLFSLNNEEAEEQQLPTRRQRWRQCHVKNIETFQNLFGQPEIKKLAPVQKTLTVRSATPVRSRKEKPLSGQKLKLIRKDSF